MTDRRSRMSLVRMDGVDHHEGFDGAFALAAFRVNRYVIDHVLRAARLLADGDLETLVVWSVVVTHNLAHLMPPGTHPTAILTRHGSLPAADELLRPVRLRDLAAVTCIPRETVRRKLAKLAARQTVLRKSGGWVVNRPWMDRTMREFTRDSAHRLLGAALEVRFALDHADLPPPAGL